MTDTHVAGPPSIAALGASYAVASDQTSSKRSFCPAFGRSDCIAVIPLIAEKAKTTVVNIGRQSLVHFRCTLTDCPRGRRFKVAICDLKKGPRSAPQVPAV